MIVGLRKELGSTFLEYVEPRSIGWYRDSGRAVVDGHVHPRNHDIAESVNHRSASTVMLAHFLGDLGVKSRIEDDHFTGDQYDRFLVVSQECTNAHSIEVTIQEPIIEHSYTLDVVLPFLLVPILNVRIDGHFWLNEALVVSPEGLGVVVLDESSLNPALQLDADHALGVIASDTIISTTGQRNFIPKY